MNECGKIRTQIAFYLDDELHEPERAALEQHLGECYQCRVQWQQQQLFLQSIRAARPLYEAAPELRQSVAAILASAQPRRGASNGLRRRLQAYLQRETEAGGDWRRRPALVAVMLVLVAFAAGVLLLTRQPPPLGPSDFALMAVATHQRYLRGQLPLEIVSDSPEQISTWFVDKVPFTLRLPNYQESSGQDKLYRLEGARLVAFKNDYAACIVYQMQQHHITLVVTSSSVARPAGGEMIMSNGLTFHHDSIEGLKVNTWTDRGLTYALVSDLAERGQQSCLVCHAGTKDRNFIEGLSPTRPKLEQH